MNYNEKNNTVKGSTAIILLIIVITVAILLHFQYLFLNRLNREHAFQTGSVLADQIGNILVSNDRKQQVLIETLKENYISKAKAVAYFLDNDPESEIDLDKLTHIAELMSIDEIHLFTAEGVIFSGTIPKYYGYSFDSGEQMAYFKPMLTDKSLSMCQDITPNTAENKSMMYAICWNNDGSRMIQIGIEPLRLIAELHANAVSEVAAGLPVNTGMNIIIANNQTEKILGSKLPELTGSSLSEIGITVNFPNDDKSANFTSVIKNDRVYCSARNTDNYLILVTQSVKEVNSEIPKMMVIVFLYLILATIVIIFTIRKLTGRILREKRNAATDPMTGLLNRRAYQDRINQIEESPETERKDLVCLMIDINELKNINDRYGHDAGDKAIRAFAEIIDRIFKPYGNLYRIGGDEFAAFLFMDYSLSLQLIEAAEKELSTWSSENNISLSMSYGVVSTQEFPDLNMEELIKIADERMYKAKTKYYQETGHDRRLYKLKQTTLR